MANVPHCYVRHFKESGLNFLELEILLSLIAPLKVLVKALELVEFLEKFGVLGCIKALWNGESQHVKDQNVLSAGKIRADVEETEAILAGYWEGVFGRDAAGA